MLVIAGGTYFYINHQADAREQALANALRVDQATVGANTQAANLHFDTQDEKDQSQRESVSRSGGEVSRHAGERDCPDEPRTGCR